MCHLFALVMHMPKWTDFTPERMSNYIQYKVWDEITHSQTSLGMIEIISSLT